MRQPIRDATLASVCRYRCTSRAGALAIAVPLKTKEDDVVNAKRCYTHAGSLKTYIEINTADDAEIYQNDVDGAI